MTSNRANDLDKIILGCKKNNPRSQKSLYQKYFGLMMNICLRYNNNFEDALENLNSGFLKIFTKIDSYEGKGSFEGWIKKIMINTNLDFIRSKAEIQKVEINESDEIGFVNSKALDKFNEEEILSMIQTLPNVSRTVFNLYAIEGYSHKEIAKMLNISEGTSHWHVSNARKYLIEKIKTLNHK